MVCWWTWEPIHFHNLQTAWANINNYLPLLLAWIRRQSRHPRILCCPPVVLASDRRLNESLFAVSAIQNDHFSMHWRFQHCIQVGLNVTFDFKAICYFSQNTLERIALMWHCVTFSYDKEALLKSYQKEILKICLLSFRRHCAIKISGNAPEGGPFRVLS